MLFINIKKIAKICKAENLLQLSKTFKWSAPTIYKYTHPERVHAIFLNTLSQIVREVAIHKNIKPTDVKIGDIFDWKE